MQTNNQLREALDRLLTWLDKHGGSFSYTDGTPADEVRSIWKERQEIVAQCRAALAGPPEQPANASAMREALEEQLSYWDSHIRTRDEEQMRKRTEAALAAPPRNCDRYRTVEEAFAACHEDRGYLSDPVAERRSTISFMLSDAQKSTEFEQCDSAFPDGSCTPAEGRKGETNEGK